MKELREKLEERKFKFKSDLNPEIVGLINQLLEKDASVRLSCEEILCVPVLAGKKREWEMVLSETDKRAVIQNYLNSTCIDKFRETPANVVEFKKNNVMVYEKTIIKVTPEKSDEIKSNQNGSVHDIRMLTVTAKNVGGKNGFGGICGKTDLLVGDFINQKDNFLEAKNLDWNILNKDEKKNRNLDLLENNKVKVLENEVVKKENFILGYNNFGNKLEKIEARELNDDGGLFFSNKKQLDQVSKNLNKINGNFEIKKQKNENRINMTNVGNGDTEKRVIYVESLKLKAQSFILERDAKEFMSEYNQFKNRKLEESSEKNVKNGQILVNENTQKKKSDFFNKVEKNNNKNGLILNQISNLDFKSMHDERKNYSAFTSENSCFQIPFSKSNQINKTEIQKYQLPNYVKNQNNFQEKIADKIVEKIPEQFITLTKIIQNNKINNLKSENPVFCESKIDVKIKSQNQINGEDKFARNVQLEEQNRPFCDVLGGNKSQNNNQRGLEIKVISRDRSAQKPSEFKTLGETINVLKQKRHANVFGNLI